MKKRIEDIISVGLEPVRPSKLRKIAFENIDLLSPKKKEIIQSVHPTVWMSVRIEEDIIVVGPYVLANVPDEVIDVFKKLGIKVVEPSK